jgi:hypothetical protein
MNARNTDIIMGQNNPSWDVDERKSSFQNYFWEMSEMKSFKLITTP